MVGGGQLARMTQQAAIALGQTLRVLALDPDEPAARVTPDVVIGDHRDLDALRRGGGGGGGGGGGRGAGGGRAPPGPGGAGAREEQAGDARAPRRAGGAGTALRAGRGYGRRR